MERLMTPPEAPILAPAELLQEIRRLMVLKGENRFRTQAFEKAAQTLIGREDLLERAQGGTLTELPGVGKGISEVLSEYLLEGTSSVRDALLKDLPVGLSELTELSGLGPKKAMILVNDLGIQSIAELEYACRENRLSNLKGFGVKSQQKLLEEIAFKKENQGQLRIDDALEISEKCLKLLRDTVPTVNIQFTGAMRRQMETVSEVEFIVELPTDGVASDQVKQRVNQALTSFKEKHPGFLPVRLHFSASEGFGYEWARTTSSAAHWSQLLQESALSKTAIATSSATEEAFYQSLGFPWISPEAREGTTEIALAQEGRLGELLPWDGVRGVFHNHTVRSDGTATLEEMVIEAKRLGYSYIGISDHSKSAFYAQGLKEDTLLEQEREIRSVQERHPEIRIFWGIESDILADGSLDYPSNVLERFDFVIASIHSRFGMNGEQMTHRILTAIQNPYTRFVGHLTGRVLLGRKPADMDIPKIIEAAAKHDVAIEMNANPSRLDLDWRWGGEMRKHRTLTSINPDAHSTAGLSDVRFGVAMARKALIPVGQILNSRTVEEVEKWLKRRL